MRRRFWFGALAAALLAAVLGGAVAGCATASSGAPVDGGGPTADGGLGPDGAAPPPGEAREITSGGGRVSGGSMQMEIQIGHGVGQQRMGGGRFQMEGASAVKR